MVDLNDAPSTGRAGVLQEELGKREGTSAVVFAGACRTRIRIAPRGAEEAQEGLSYDVEALRYSGGTEGGHFERMEVVGGRGGSLPDVSYLRSMIQLTTAAAALLAAPE